MSKHEEKSCERCGNLFECKVGDVGNCQCSSLAVSDAVNDFLEESYFDCLCKNCLQDLNQKMTHIEHLNFPQANELVEDLHFYMDGNRFVFTETYFLLRGHCCRSNCRHCPYGFNNT